ncbi:DUF7544 domain-containing protein [Mesoterricola silvestris]|uniref:Uncharacterized protein n=1 Tax=Mesoterricola silvestris TaxID=2927979 RepID=A0AA48KBN2_9BACT|nr:hypothetical protein [Mesoterricola silvestris]BDU74497.1 hypothetical protein METEAL_36710 [Mesoterricola silvestris]
MISATDPIQRSFDWTRKSLFSPFDLGKWCTIGFTSFLAALMGGGSLNFRSGRPFRGLGSAGSPTSPLEALGVARLWVLGHPGLVVSLGVLALAFLMLVSWLGARGQFMFLDNVVSGRGRVAEPWNRFREHGNRVFLFLLALQIAGIAVLALGLFAGWRIAEPDIADLHFGIQALKGILAAAGIILPLGLVVVLVGQVLRDFVVPVMYLRGTTVAGGFGVWWNELVPGNGGSFLLFYLLKWLLSLAAATLIILGTCFTCCLAGLPYVSSVVFLPVAVFFRAYSLAFMGQCGEAWVLLRDGSQH